jgi:hypothetical protein
MSDGVRLLGGSLTTSYLSINSEFARILDAAAEVDSLSVACCWFQSGVADERPTALVMISRILPFLLIVGRAVAQETIHREVVVYGCQNTGSVRTPNQAHLIRLFCPLLGALLGRCVLSPSLAHAGEGGVP